VTVVIKVNPNLLPGVDPVPAKDRRAARGYPHARQRVGVHLVLLHKALPLFVDVDAAVLPMVDLVMPNDRIARCANLDARESVACQHNISFLQQLQLGESDDYRVDIIGNRPKQNYCFFTR